MIPILFDSSATSYTSNGIGRLSDCIEYYVTEERNGVFELEMQYPITGVHYSEIVKGNIIVASHDEVGDVQPFVIYRISKPINGVIEVNAHHISYRLSNVILKPFTASSAADAFSKFETEVLTEQDFTFWTDVTTAGNFKVDVPTSARAMLGGVQGSILDVYGGEYQFDNNLVRLYAHRGADNGVTIRYGKNLVNINAVSDSLDLYNAVIPYWMNTDGDMLYGGVVSGNGGIEKSAYWTNENNVQMTNENAVPFEFTYYVEQVTTMNLSDEFEERPTIEELEARAQQILNSNEPWLPSENIKIDFVALWQTEEYKDIAPLERVRLCDTVSVYYPELGVSTKAKVIKVVWDGLTERYSEIELGKAQSSFAQVVTASTEEAIKNLPTTSMMETAINHATSLITGGLGGHIVYLFDANGYPTDMLIMDTEDVNTAMNVLRFNVNGIGFSHNGISGPYTSAWTLDGSFVADFITAGELSANRIKGGTLTLGGAGNGNGVLQVLDRNGNVIGTWDNTGISATGNFIMHYSTGPMVGMVDVTASLKESYYIINHGRYYTYGFEIYTNKGNSEWLIKKVITSSNDITEYEKIPGASVINSTQRNLLSLAETSRKIVLSGEGVNQPSQIEEGFNQLMFGWSRNYSSSGTGDLAGKFIQLYFTPDQLYYAGAVEYLNGAPVPRLNVRSYDEGTHGVIELYAGTNNFFNLSRGTIDITATNYSTLVRVYVTQTKQQINGNQIQFASSSSRRYKHDITDLTDDELKAERLYDLPVRQGVYNDGIPLQYWDLEGKTIPMFIAEEVEEIYPSAVIRDAEKQEIESWDERRIIPPMLKLIQDQKSQIDTQQAKINELEERLAALEEMIGGLVNANS